MTLVSEIGIQVVSDYSVAIDLATKVCNLRKNVSLDLANGTGADQADQVWHDTRTLNASANEDIDLAGVLTDLLTGTALTFARIKAVFVFATSGNTNNVRVTRPASNGVPLFLAAGDGIDIPPKGFFAWAAPGAAGVVVTASTGDLLNIANSGAGSSVTYDIVVIGASA